MNDIFTRTSMLIGEKNLSKLESSTVLIVGIGGVGGTCFEALVRSGVGKLIIIDNDNVDISNLNRQILFLQNDVGQCKVEVAKRHAQQINDNCTVVPLGVFLSAENMSILDTYHIDFIVDAIDAIYSKVDVVKYAQGRNIPYITAVGMGKRLDPTQLTITTLNKTTGDPLAKKFRYLLKQANLDIAKIPCVFSKEIPVSNGERTPSSMMPVPSTCGLFLASYVIKTLLKEDINNESKTN